MSDSDVESMQIHLNSKFADNYINNSYSNCEFFLPVIEIPPQHHIYISCVLANIPYSFYNIDTNNNKLSYNIVVGASYETINIDVGNYNIYQLITFLQTNTPFTFSYSSITNKLTITHPTSDFSFDSSNSTALELLGFKTTDSLLSLSSYNLSLTSIYCVNLQSKHCICVQVNYQTGNINVSNKLSNNILASIPISGAPYSMITYRNSNAGFRSNLYTNSLGYLNVKLIDQNNNLINFNGCHWTLTLQLDIKNFVD